MATPKLQHGCGAYSDMHALWSSARSCETNQVAECQTRQQSAHHRTHTFNRCSSGVLLSSAPPCSHGNTTHGTCLRGPSLSTRKPYSVAPTRYLHRTATSRRCTHCHTHRRPPIPQRTCAVHRAATHACSSDTPAHGGTSRHPAATRCEPPPLGQPSVRG